MGIKRKKINNNLNKSKIKKTFEVKVFSKSEELAFLDRIVRDRIEKDVSYDDTVLFYKIFFGYNDGVKGDKKFYLKNEYLYLTTKGIISYLRSRKERDKQFYEVEGKMLVNVIKDRANNQQLNVISIGAGDSLKELRAFEELKKCKKVINNIHYRPVDVSPILIQLGLNNFSAEKDLFENKEFKVTSTVANIWHLSNFIRENPEERNNLFGSENRLFLLLGGTLGNFQEEDFMDQLSELMEEGDELLLSVELKDSGIRNDFLNDSSFLLAPLNYVPFFYGYTMYHRDFLVKGEDAKIDQDDTISVVPDSESITPYIEVPRKKRNKIVKTRVNLVKITRYDLLTLKQWIEDTYIYTNKERDSFNLSVISCDELNGVAIMHIKKVRKAVSGTSTGPKVKDRYYRYNGVSLDRAVVERTFEVKLFSDSEELSFISQINGNSSRSGIGYKREYRDEDTFYKLFNQYEDVEEKDTLESDYYLKNKYLYVTTTGVMNYLRLYEAQKKTLGEFFDFEKTELRQALDDLIASLDENESLNIVSLGAAISDKESEVLKIIVGEEETKERIKYFAVDISPMLLQLGINNFARESVFNDFDVKSLVADFWSIAAYIREDKDDDFKKRKRQEFFGEGKRLFLVLGGTFGNYTEKEFLDQVIEMMDEGDELLISVKLQHPEDNYTPDKDYQNLPGNEDFLLEPLKYIPLYYGYSRYYRDFLITDINANLSENDDEMKFVSVVPKSECTAPYIVVDGIGDNPKKAKIRLCWSTRYGADALKEWISNTYVSSDGVYKLDFCKEGKGNKWFHQKCESNNYAVLRMKKVRLSFSKKIKEYLSDCGLSDNDQINNIMETLSEKSKLDNRVYEELLKIKGGRRNVQNVLKILSKFE